MAYASTPGKDAEKAIVRKGLIQALDACKDNPNKAFLLTLLRMCGEAEDAPVFVKYLNDEYLAEWAISGLTSIKGTEEVLLDLMKKEAAPKAALAHAAGLKKLASAEPILLAWLKGADAPTTRAIYQSLAQCGTSSTYGKIGVKVWIYKGEVLNEVNRPAGAPRDAKRGDRRDNRGGERRGRRPEGARGERAPREGGRK